MKTNNERIEEENYFGNFDNEKYFFIYYKLRNTQAVVAISRD